MLENFFRKISVAVIGVVDCSRRAVSDMLYEMRRWRAETYHRETRRGVLMSLRHGMLRHAAPGFKHLFHKSLTHQGGLCCDFVGLFLSRTLHLQVYPYFFYFSRRCCSCLFCCFCPPLLSWIEQNTNKWIKILGHCFYWEKPQPNLVSIPRKKSKDWTFWDLTELGYD